MKLENSLLEDEKNSSKERLVEAAFKLFGEKGLASVSVRELAKEANVNIASINYYFGSKDGLYLHIINIIASKMKNNINAINTFLIEQEKIFLKSKLSENSKKLFYINCVKNIIENGVRVMFKTFSENNFMHKIIVKEQMNKGLGFEILFEEPLKLLFSIIDRLISQIDTKSPQHIVKLRTHAIYGQSVVFICTYATVNRRLGSENYTDENIEDIINVLKEHTSSILNSFLKD